MADDTTKGDVGDFVVYHEEFFGGFSEALEQNSNIFNEASQGAIQLRPNRLIGHFEKESFFKSVTNLIAPRDVALNDVTADLKLEQGEIIGVKLNRRIGPVTNTIDSFRKIGESAETMSFMLGQQIGKAAAVDMTNTSIAALVGGISNLGATALHDGTAGTPTHSGLVDILSKMGDGEGGIIAWVMHSKSYFDLVKQSIADKVFEVAGVTIYTGTVATLNRPVVVVDSSALTVPAAGEVPIQYNILGLTEGACIVDESERQEVVSDTVTGYENLLLRIQGEYAYNLKLKGIAYDVANGGSNPNAAAVALATNWDSVLSAANGIKGGPGARGLFD